MQTIKGLIALLLTAVAVFTAVEIYNSKAEAKYIAKLKNTIADNTVKTAKQSPSKVTTNAVDQARQKVKNLNL